MIWIAAVFILCGLGFLLLTVQFMEWFDAGIAAIGIALLAFGCLLLGRLTS